MQFDAEQIEALETAGTVEELSERLGPKMAESVLDEYMRRNDARND